MSDQRAAAAAPAVERVGSYRLKKTLGIGSFGKARLNPARGAALCSPLHLPCRSRITFAPQVKLAEHIETGLHVAIKILNMNRVTSSEMRDKVRSLRGCMLVIVANDFIRHASYCCS